MIDNKIEDKEQALQYIQVAESMWKQLKETEIMIDRENRLKSAEIIIFI